MDTAIFTLAQAAQDATGESVSVGSVWDFVLKGGLLMIPIGICSLVVVAVSVERAIVLRRKDIVPDGFEAGLLPKLEQGLRGKRDAEQFCTQSASPIGRTVLAGVERMGRPMETIEKHMAAAGEHEITQLRRRLRGLSVVAAIAPLLGLLGTIFGMIKAFQTVALSGEALGKTELLAAGIYEAMITTAAGLVVAIPALVLHHWFASRIEHLTRLMDGVCVRSVEAIAEATGHAGEETEHEHRRETVPVDSYPVRGGAIG